MATRICPKCNATVDSETANFCPACGTRLQGIFMRVEDSPVKEKDTFGAAVIFACIACVICLFIYVYYSSQSAAPSNPQNQKAVQASSKNPLTQMAGENIPWDSTEQSAGPLRITKTEEFTNKSYNDGHLITCEVEVPWDIKRDQIKPTFLLVVKKIRIENPTCKWFVVFLEPEGLAGKGFNAGKAEYWAGCLSIDYGMPSEEQLAEFEAVPDRDSPVPRPMSKSDFEKAVLVFDTYFPYLRDFGDADQAKKWAAKETGIPLQKVKNLLSNLSLGYMVGAWGKEQIGACKGS